MKKLITILLVLFILCGCQLNKQTNDKDENYLNLIDTLKDRSVFASESDSFDIELQVAKTNDAYRFYVIIDNPNYAMYGVEAIAVEKGVDYSLNMAANVGVFEDIEYNMVPGQANPDKGYVTGLSISGVTASSTPTIHVLVQWYSKKQEVHQEFIELTGNFEEE